MEGGGNYIFPESPFFPSRCKFIGGDGLNRATNMRFPEFPPRDYSFLKREFLIVVKKKKRGLNRCVPLRAVNTIFVETKFDITRKLRFAFVSVTNEYDYMKLLQFNVTQTEHLGKQRIYGTE